MGDLVDTAMLRQHVTTALDDEALDRFIDAHEQTLLAKLGPLGEVTDVRWLRGELITLLGRPPVEILQVVEYDEYNTAYTLVADDDYMVDGSTLRRLELGPNPPLLHRRRLEITYSPADDEARRRLAVIKLVALDVSEADAGAKISRTVGTHSWTMASPADRKQMRNDIWSELENANQPLFA